MTYRWDDLPEWQQNYLLRLGPVGQGTPTAWCHIEARPLDDLPGKRAAYVPSYRAQWRRPVRGEISIPDSRLWIDPKVWAQCVEAPTRRQRVRQWARRRLRFMTRDGRQTRELGRLLEAIDRQAHERGQ
jgi:hypothetical protein